jgi:hypothetical protein
VGVLLLFLKIELLQPIFETLRIPFPARDPLAEQH